VERLGLVHIAAGLDWLEWEAEAAFADLTQIPGEERHTFLLRDVFADAAAHRMIPDLLRICEEWRPDLILRNDFEFASCIAAERLGIPDATLGVDLFMSPQRLEPLIGAQLAYARSAWGLAPFPPLGMLYRNLYASFVPPSYQFPDAASLATMHAVQPRIADAGSGDCLPETVARMPADRATVYVSLGTVFNREPELFRMILAALADEPLNVVVTVGNNQDPEWFGPQPPNVSICRYIPQSLLFGRCDAAVISGSSNTVTTALSYGLPLVLIPLASTQPLHAMRCTQLGVGIALRRRGAFAGYFDGPEANEQTIHQSVRRVLDEPQFRRAARKLQEEIASLPGPETTVHLLERIAAERNPVAAGAGTR
jgi:UDP:flavonoid glycosyltransferase YjiC (YdhE family)